MVTNNVTNKWLTSSPIYSISSKTQQVKVISSQTWNLLKSIFYQ